MDGLKQVKYIFLLCVFVGGIQLSVFSQKHRLRIVQTDTTLTAKQFANMVDTLSYHKGQQQAKEKIYSILKTIQAKAFLASNLDSLVADSNQTTAWVRTGHSYKWAFLSPGNVDEGWLSKTGFRERVYRNRPFDFTEVLKIQDAIVKQAENNGYPFAAARLDSLLAINGALSAALMIEKNQLYTIDSLTLKGKSKCKVGYMKNYLGIRPDDVYDESKINRISGRIRELAFVKEVAPPSARFYEKSTVITLYLEDKKASQFDGILGVLPDNNKPGKVLLTGELNLRLQSAFGRGELIDLRWRKLQAQTQDLKVNLAYPYLFATPFGIDYKLDLYKRDTTFLNVNNNIGVQYMLMGGNYFKVFLESRSSSLLSTVGLENVSTLPQNADTRLVLYGIGVKFDRVDYRLNPRKGFKVAWNGGAGNKNIKRNSSLNPEIYDSLKLKTIQINSDVTLEVYFPLGKRHVIKTRMQAATMYNQQLFQNELFRIGGLRTLRGFDEESIFASSYGIGTVEYRFLLETNSYFYGFFDGAWYERNTPNRYLRDTPYGFGAGISFETKLGIFTLNYALGSEFGKLSQIRAAKIHFGIISQF
jgi:outer membrane protein assembly factor BamA